MKKTLVGGVGYHNLSDLSLGPILTAHLASLEWPANVEIDADMSFGPILIVQRFQSRPEQYNRIVLFGAIERGRTPGTVTSYRWTGELPPEDEIQARVSEAVTGVVSLDNLLIVGEYFGIWPDELFVVEVEPQDNSWGLELSPTLAAIRDDIVAVVRRAAIQGEVGEPDLNGARPLIANPPSRRSFLSEDE